MPLRYTSPARRWLDGFPLGNGRMGAMWFGDAASGSLALNDETFFSPGTRHRDLTGARAALDEVRALLAADDPRGAQAVAAKLFGTPAEMSAYQPVGTLSLCAPLVGGLLGFHRTLDLVEGVASLEERRTDGALAQQVLALRRPSVLVIDTTESTHPLAFGLTSPFLSVSRTLDHRTVAATGAWREVPPNRTLVAGSYRLTDTRGLRRLRVAVAVRLLEGELATRNDEPARGLLLAPGPSLVVLTTATDLDGSDPLEACVAELDRLNDARQAMAAARAWHREVMSRASVRIGPPVACAASPESAPTKSAGVLADLTVADLPTDQRLHAFRVGGVDDALLVELADFGRYLLVASTLGGSSPPNLQGIWNEDTEPAWSARWTLNINLQMNLWAAGPWCLPEAGQVLLDFTESLADAGAVTARELYGTDGWVVHHNSDVWRATEPTTMVEIGLFAGATLWLCDQLWSLQRFHPDISGVRRVLVLMEGALAFVRGWLVEDDAGHLVTSPSSTPENGYLLDGNPAPEDLGADLDYGRHAWLCRSPTLDQWLVLALVGDLRAARATAGDDDRAASDELDQLASRLLPLQLQDGRIGEWSTRKRPRDRGHRHLSSLYGVFPGILDVRGEPDVAEAATRTLAERQGQVLSSANGWGGWSRIWASCCWARLGDGERAYDSLLHWARTGVAPVSLLGVFPEFDGSPADGAVFQIDQNLGAPAALAEMLLQGHTERIEVLPAIPARWRSGTFRGLRVPGGHAVDAEWENGRLTRLSIHAGGDGEVVVVLPANTWHLARSAEDPARSWTVGVLALSQPDDLPSTDRRLRLIGGRSLHLAFDGPTDGGPGGQRPEDER